MQAKEGLEAWRYGRESFPRSGPNKIVPMSCILFPRDKCEAFGRNAQRRSGNLRRWQVMRSGSLKIGAQVRVFFLRISTILVALSMLKLGRFHLLIVPGSVFASLCRDSEVASPSLLLPCLGPDLFMKVGCRTEAGGAFKTLSTFSQARALERYHRDEIRS